MAIRAALGDATFRLTPKLFRRATEYIERMYAASAAVNTSAAADAAAAATGRSTSSAFVPDDPSRNLLALALRFHFVDAITNHDGCDGSPMEYLRHNPSAPEYWPRLYQFASDMAAMQMIHLTTN
jgi:hypothetical protein